jgi:hypothetical protein
MFDRLVPIWNSRQREITSAVQRIVAIETLCGNGPFIEARHSSEGSSNGGWSQQPSLRSGGGEAQLLHTLVAGTLAKPGEQIERHRWPELAPVKFTLGQELEEIAQVVAVRDRSVRATPESTT